VSQKSKTSNFCHKFVRYWPNLKFCCYTQQKIWNKVIIKDPTTPQKRRFTTLCNISIIWTLACPVRCGSLAERWSRQDQASSQPLMLLIAVVVYVLRTWTVSLCLAADLARTAAGLFIMLARQSRTRCQMNLEILTASIVLNGFQKQLSSAATSVTSALEVIFNEMRYINLRFTLLTFT